MSSTAPLHIPWPYTLFHLYIEPLCAFLGSLQASFLPTQYLNFFTPLIHPVLSTDAQIKSCIFQIPLDQVAACYVLFAWNEAITLRVARHDLRVWKAVIGGIALCDVLHLAGCWRAMGAEVFCNPALWRAEEWINMGLLWVPLAMRLCFVLEVGVTKGNGRGGKSKVR